MKKDRKGRFVNQKLYEELDESFNISDMRYWGIFGEIANERHPERHIRIDPKRFQKTTRTTLDEKQLKVINQRRSHYFHPAKIDWYDYNCNWFIHKIDGIRLDWYSIFKGLIQREADRIKKPKKLNATNDQNFMCGITDYDESQGWAEMNNMINQQKYISEVYKIIYSLYAQFFHQMASQIEAITVRVLARNGKDVNRFDRNALYDYSGEKGTARDFEHYRFHDKLYCIWHFIKHNTLSTYKNLKDKYPEVLYGEEYQQGHIAASYVKFSEKLIIELLDGCAEFFKEYCKCVYHEDYEQAQWNYERYFYDIAYAERENMEDPMGLQYYP